MRSVASCVTAVHVVVVVALLAPAARGQGPGSAQALVPYSGRLDSSGTPVSGTHDFRFGLYSSATASTAELAGTPSTALWWEEAPAVPVHAGSFSWVLGSRSALVNSLFLNNALYLAIAVRPSGTSTWTVLQGMQRLSQVPYTVRSDQADGLRVDSGEAHWRFSGHDLLISSDSRGNGGRAVVMGASDSLVINFGGDFAGGTHIQSDLRVTGNVTTGALRIPTDQGALTISDDDGEVIVRVAENADRGKVTLEDSADLVVAGTVTWHCPAGMSRVGTWCIDNAASGSNVNWNAATLACHDAGKDLCPYTAYMACDTIEPAGSACTAATDDDARVIWTRDRHFVRTDFGEPWQGNLVCFVGNDTVLECLANELHEYFCCVPGVRL